VHAAPGYVFKLSNYMPAHRNLEEIPMRTVWIVTIGTNNTFQTACTTKEVANEYKKYLQTDGTIDVTVTEYNIMDHYKPIMTE
jgi:hypothetical protein